MTRVKSLLTFPLTSRHPLVLSQGTASPSLLATPAYGSHLGAKSSLIALEINEKKQIEKDHFDLKVSELSSEGQEEWLVLEEDVPDILWQKVKDISLDISFLEFLREIKFALYSLYGDKNGKARTFLDSRFTPINEMIERGMRSCGALSLIFASILRKHGVAVKLIHGILSSQDPNGANRHSWLEIYDSVNKTWFSADPTRRDFKIHPDAVRLKEYKTWSDLKPDLEKQEY